MMTDFLLPSTIKLKLYFGHARISPEGSRKDKPRALISLGAAENFGY